MKSIRQILIGSAALMPLLAGSAWGQTAAPPAADQSQQLQEVVVTAQKRVERLQDVPIAVNAASGAQLAASGITSTLQLNTIAPGLNIRSQAGSFLPSIRGVSTQSNVVENPVALYVDGVYFPQQRDGLRDLLDIAQITVLKGPQGTLFGRNSTGGVIQITTEQPSHNFHGNASVELDNYETAKGKLYVTGGLTDNLAASFSAEYASQQIGWGYDPVDHSDTYKLNHSVTLRSKLFWEPTPKTTVSVIFDYLDMQELANSFQTYPGTQFSQPRLPPFATPPAGYVIGAPIGPTAPLKSPWDSYAGQNSYLAFQGGGTSVQINHDLDFAKLVSITSYRKGVGSYQFDDSASPTPYFIVKSPVSPNEDYTEELQLISNKSQFNWQTGVYYFHNLNGADPIGRSFAGFEQLIQRGAKASMTFGNETTQSVAPYAQVDYEILPKTKLTVGARYTYEQRRYDGVTLVVAPSGAVSVPAPAQVLSEEFYNTTVHASLDHQFSDDILAYASFNTGFKSGGFNILNPANPPYNPESLKTYEIGLKNQLFDRRVRLNLAGFYYQYTNIQVISFASGPQVITNGAGAELYGLDVDFEAKVTPALRLSGGLELEHSEFTNYPNATLGAFNPTTNAYSLFVGSAKGKRLPLAQNFSANLAADYHYPTSVGAFDFDLTGNYNGDYYFEPDNNLEQKAYLMLNTSLTWNLPGDRYSLAVWGKNLLDKAIISQTTTQVFGYATTYNNAPLTFGATAKVKF